jgi:hydroxypyruvate reductase
VFENRQRHAETPAHEVALDCLAAGISAAHPLRIGREQITYDARTDELTIGDDSHDLTDVSAVHVVGGGNAAGAIAQLLEDVLGRRIDDGVVVTDARNRHHRYLAERPSDSERARRR